MEIDRSSTWKSLAGQRLSNRIAAIAGDDVLASMLHCKFAIKVLRANDSALVSKHPVYSE
jgi:hypothetical protein